MSEGVEILITADDQASKKFDQVANNIDSKVKRIRDVSGKAKASTEFAGAIARSLGDSQFAQAAGGVAQLTEKIGAFSEVSKLGKAGALGFKAGLAGVALVVGYKIGEAIGNWWYDTAKWTAEIEKANKSLELTADRVAEVLSTSLSIDTEKISLIADTDEQRKEMLSWQTELSIEAEEYANAIKQTEKELEAERTTFQKIFGISEEQKKSDAAHTAELRKSLEVVEKEQKAVQAKLRTDVEELRVLKESVALKKKNDDYIKSLTEEVELLKASKAEHAAIEALQKTGGDATAAKKVELLLREKDALLAKAEAQKKADDEAKKTSDEQVRASERIADLKKNELAKLEEQRILLTEGKSAAHAFALEQQGIDKATAKRIATEKSLLDKQGEKIAEQVPQQATQGRLLTRGQGDDIRKRQLDVAMKQYEALRIVAENSKQWKSKTEIAFEVAGLR